MRVGLGVGTALLWALAGCGGGGGSAVAVAPTASTPTGGSSTPAGGASTPSGGASAPAGSGPVIAGCAVFPASAIFNTRIDDTAQFPTHPSSAAWKTAIDASSARRLHLDWGQTEDPSQHSVYWGIPYNVVDGSAVQTLWPRVTYSSGVPEESDCAVAQGGGYALQRDCSAVSAPHMPIPTDATVKVEGGYCPVGQACPDGDHHILVVEKAACRLWEVYYAGTAPAEAGANGAWDVYATAAWDLKTLAQRLAGWTSADAAGLPILPLLCGWMKLTRGRSNTRCA